MSHIVIDARIRRASTGRPIDRLVEHLQDIDHTNKYTILVQPDDDWQMRAESFTTVPCPFPQFSLNPINEIRFAWQIYRLKPDLVHFGMTQQPLLYFGRIVTMTHDLTMFKFVRRGKTSLPIYKLKIGLYKFMMRWSHWKSNKITVPTKFVADDVAEFQPSVKSKIVVTYEASEPPLKAPGERPKQVGANDKFILYVGTAFPHKNLPKLIGAFEILHEDNPGLKLVLTGKTEKHYEELADFAKTQPVSKSIIFTGFVSDASLKWLYQHTQVYCFPSLSEGFGLPALEAMSYDAPVAASNASCIPEVCGNAAMYFDATNPRDIANKVAQIINSKRLREDLIKKGAKQIKKYSWEKMTRQTLEIYKEVLAKN